MPKKSNLKHQIEDERDVESLERIIAAIELLEARGRILDRERDKIDKLEDKNKELNRRNDELIETIKQHHSYIAGFSTFFHPAKQ